MKTPTISRGVLRRDAMLRLLLASVAAPAVVTPQRVFHILAQVRELERQEVARQVHARAQAETSLSEICSSNQVARSSPVPRWLSFLISGIKQGGVSRVAAVLVD